MTEQEMQQRTKQFALRVMRLVDALPTERSSDVIGRQLFHCVLSVGANYRAACHAKSHAGFVNRLGIVEEADESSQWMELLVDAGIMEQKRLGALRDEAAEVLRIVSPSRLTARRNARAVKSQIANRKSESEIRQ